MIYEPQIPFNVQLSLVTSFVNAIARLAVDYVRQQNQPWEYYVGIGFGGAALSTGIPGANAIMYAAGAGTVKLFFETSPGAAHAEIFLDGVSDANLDLSDEIIDTLEWVINIPDDGQYHSISVLNLGSIDVEEPTDWLSILAIEFVDTLFADKEYVPVATVIHSFTIKDAKTIGTARVKNTQSVAVYHVLGTLTLADLTAYHNALANAIDDVTDGYIINTDMTINPTFPTGLKGAAAAGSDVQEGGNLSFLTTSGYSDAIRVPAFKASLFGADGQSIPVEGVALMEALRDLLLGDVADPLDITASTPDGIEYVSLTTAKKSFRK